MIVVLGEDETTKSLTRCMCLQNPDEEVVRLDPKTYRFLTAGGKTLLDFEKPLKRISFVDHGSKTECGDYDQTQFMNILKRELTAAANIDPSIKTSLKNIDLITCETGSVVEDEPTFAYELASAFQAQLGNEFNVEIKAFSNMMTSRTEQLTITTVGADEKNEHILEVSCFQDLKSFAAYQQLLFNTDTVVAKFEKTAEQLAELKFELEDDPNNQAIKKQVGALEKEYKSLETQLTQLTDRIKSYKTIAAVTDDARKTLDTNLKCNFTYQVKASKLNNELKQLKNDKKENEKKMANLQTEKNKLNDRYQTIKTEGIKLTKDKNILQEKVDIQQSRLEKIKQEYKSHLAHLKKLDSDYKDAPTHKKAAIKAEGERLYKDKEALKKQGKELSDELDGNQTKLSEMEERLEELKEKLNAIKTDAVPKLQEQEAKLTNEKENIQSAIESKEKDLSNLLPPEKKPKTPLQAAGMYQAQKETAKGEAAKAERSLPAPTTPPRHRR